jgi:transposase
LLNRTNERDFSSRGLVAELAERGLKVDYGRSGISFEKLSFKKTSSPANATVPILPAKALLSAEFLPKYSPDLSPIKQVFAKRKHLLRKVAPRAALKPFVRRSGNCSKLSRKMNALASSNAGYAAS